ncbi:MAG: electron transport complex subunit RsxG [Candidatus Polarisedimenticolaceae bacterium]|nr:electron transport complex subunit RsxG [Candidatus Polarisedimenticolaceae bacterium]
MSKKIIAAALLLGFFAVIGTGLVAFTYEMTKDQIAENERLALLRSLQALVPADTVNNDMPNDTIIVDDKEKLGTHTTTIYRGRKDGDPIAAVFTSIAPDGYSGQIKLLVAVRADGTLGGVRVITHKETPGLGDKIEVEKDDWIFAFDNRSLGDPTVDKWAVKKDGGIFDQFTGATITPRAIVNSVKRTLIYASEHKEAIYDLDIEKAVDKKTGGKS